MIKGLSNREYLSFLNRIRRRSPRWRDVWVSRPHQGPGPERLGVLAIMKNESLLIEEWIDHYLSLGVNNIFLIDNGSTDGTREKIKPWIQKGRVEMVSYLEPHQQQRHYWTAFNEFGIRNRCDWLAIADIDEFWHCKSGEQLADYLFRQKTNDAIYVNWTMFGSSGHDHQPRSVRRSLIRKDPKLARQTKCIFRTSLPLRENDIEVHNIRNALPWRVKLANNELQLNHYATQSRSFWFGVKMKRGDAFYKSQDLAELAKRFDSINEACTETCTLLRDYTNRTSED